MAVAAKNGTTRILVEGWRFIPHSYAIVNQWQLLALLRRSDVEVFHRDLPYLYPHWQSRRGLLPEPLEAALAAIPAGDPREAYDTTLRIGFPYDLTPSASRRTAVFLTSEFGGLPSSHFAGAPDFAALARGDDVFVVTPSHWAAQACSARGLRAEQVIVMPHGANPATYRPMPERRDAIRARLGLQAFVFMNVGAMTPNKGVQALLRAFAALVRRGSDVRLLLKGLDSVFSSRDRLAQELGVLAPAERDAVLARITYIGETLSAMQMAELYQAADAYVSPYHAEGFNIPVLEAAACGLPLIVTGGGATDDFVTDAFARKIKAGMDTVRFEDVLGRQLMPDLAHLVALMQSVMEDDAWRRAANVAGPAHVHARFNWDSIVDAFLQAVA